MKTASQSRKADLTSLNLYSQVLYHIYAFSYWEPVAEIDTLLEGQTSQPQTQPERHTLKNKAYFMVTPSSKASQIATSHPTSLSYL